MLRLLNATSPHGLSQGLDFLEYYKRENSFDTSDIVTSHTACLPAKKNCGAILINATSPHGLCGRMGVMLVEHNKM